jgi:NAD(P)-dependent dehydrogenase (short-subunit alcohol dehydrogenase family)
MILAGKIAIVYGGGGVIGGEIARTFAREGARVHVAGRTAEKLEKVVTAIRTAGGNAYADVLDVLDAAATARHADAVVRECGRVDVALSAVGFMHVQGKPLLELSLEEYEKPVAEFGRAQFSVAKAVAPQMAKQGSGAILFISTPGAVRAYEGVLGFATACAALEGFTRQLAGELGPSGVRVVCLRPDAIPETLRRGSYARRVFAPAAERAGLSLEAMMATVPQGNLLKREIRLSDVAETAAFAASDRGGALTATTLNLSNGSVVG